MSSKVFIVTGASKGIGAAITQRLLSQGNKVVLTARSKDALEAVKSSHPGRVEYVAGDMTDAGISEKIVAAAVSAFGRVDGLVINHGILSPNKLSEAPIEEVRHVYDVNVFSYLAIAKAALDELRTSKGSIVWISSGAASKAYAAWGAYGSSKAAVNSLSGHFAAEEKDITSIAIAPGRVNTDMQADIRAQGKERMDKAQYENFVEAFTTGILLKPEQPGYVVADLVAKPAKELSGKFLNWNSPELAAYQQ
ncbi:Short-chain dehydrogenase [Geosmithia morbida]|uniref:Short-chain dehydrogenase n=1 Tax=Geosmithia morbida TaxID=1094350 RepID=A0A9P4YW23_9HYPO|nr:Short-chain dehydrogenase [Geosmithia morbida]KAF4122857.1 Short-chain dehydrogenase [Geosmithia morbida]